ncbi:hypothetical protein Clacol_008669 [Clathrus columnatus]|uniref:Uncharacterized protein n=1 Tax=Clathrus columnatus TaxID=1419009 RepID=A0AAV5ANJ1_9AGAM|nr:hypothetical protein Clacol_008669 [Clathrus columnatus]
MAVLARIQTLAAQEGFGLGSGMLDGLIAPTLTSFETELALLPLLGDCDFDLEFTGQDDNFLLIPQVSLLSDSGDTLLPPFIFPNNTKVQIDPTNLFDSDNCSSVSVIMALQDLDPNLNPTVTVMPFQECTVAADGLALIYVTSNDTPLSSAFDDRLAMTNESICAVSTLLYVNTIDELIQEVAGNLTSSS